MIEPAPAPLDWSTSTITATAFALSEVASFDVSDPVRSAGAPAARTAIAGTRSATTSAKRTA